MPDLKSELSKVINSWEAPTQAAPKPEPTAKAKPYFTVTNNVCRATFDCIRDNPGKTRQELAVMLEKAGYKRSSTTSLMGQMVRQGKVRDGQGLLYATTDVYTPLKSAKVFSNMQAKQEKPRPAPTPAPTPAPVPERKQITLISKRTGEVLNPRPAPEAKEWEPKDVIDKLTVRQAIALFKELRNILVG